MNLTRTNLLLGLLLILYIICSSKFIDKKDSIFYNQFYKLMLLILVLIVYPYHKQAGVIVLIIALITHLPIFKEAFTTLITPEPNIIENRESNYEISNSKRLIDQEKIKEVKKRREVRLNALLEQGHITPLEKDIIKEIELQFEGELDILKKDQPNLHMYTDEGNAVDVGLLPDKINLDDINYESLVRDGQIISF